jgi:DNA-binding IclR family transcriptional regulator
MDTASESREQMYALAQATGETVQLAVFDHQSVLYIRILESRQAVRMSTIAERARPPIARAWGKVLLAHQPEEVVRQVLDAGLKRYTDATITDPALLAEEARRDPRQGYAFDDEEIEIGLRCVAAPSQPFGQRDRGHQRGGAGAAHDPRRTRRPRSRRWSPAADSISRRLGYMPSLSSAMLAE